MTRAVIVETLQSSISDERSRQRLERDIQRLAEDLNDTSLSDHERRDIQRELEEKILRHGALLRGGSMTEWLHVIKNHKLLAEFFSRPNGARHRAESWSQKDWDLNRREIAKGVEELLVRELVSPTWTQATLESLGLAEVVYPGLERTTPPPELLAILPSTIVRDHITNAWPDLLAMLCDTIRAEGIVTVGDADKDHEWPYFPIGRWLSMSERFGSGYLLPFRGTATGERESRRNRYCRNVLIAAGCSSSHVENLRSQFMDTLFRQFLDFVIFQLHSLT